MQAEKGSSSERRGLLDLAATLEDLEHGVKPSSPTAASPPIQLMSTEPTGDDTDTGCCSDDCRLRIVMALNIGYTVAEMAAYFIWGSLSMLTDAFHNASDVLAIAIALYCERMKRPSSSTAQRMTFGVKRFEVIGGFANGLLLLALCMYILLDAIPRLVRPPVLDGSQEWVMIAAAGVPVNLISAVILCRAKVEVAHAHSHGDGSMHSHGNTGRNLNMLAVFLHSVGDTITSVVVTATAWIINADGRAYTRGSCADGYDVVDPGWRGSAVAINRHTDVACRWYDYLDPVASILLAVGISVTVIPLLREAWPVLLAAAPHDLDLHRLRRDLEGIPRVAGVGAVHVWPVDGGCTAAIVHVFVEQQTAASPSADPTLLLSTPSSALGSSFDADAIDGGVSRTAGMIVDSVARSPEQDDVSAALGFSPPSPDRIGEQGAAGDGFGRMTPPPEQWSFTTSRADDSGSWLPRPGSGSGTPLSVARPAVAAGAVEREARRRVWGLLHDQYGVEHVTIQTMLIKSEWEMTAGLVESQRRYKRAAAPGSHGWAAQWAAAAASQGVLIEPPADEDDNPLQPGTGQLQVGPLGASVAADQGWARVGQCFDSPKAAPPAPQCAPCGPPPGGVSVFSFATRQKRSSAYSEI
jgi:Co/Zn/Cd efflux system component